MTLYDWPQAAAFGGSVPKNKIYRNANVNTAVRKLFVRIVDRIIWSHKLAPETINLTATKSVAEIQVFCIVVRSPTPDHDMLRAIDRAIPSPLIFELNHEGYIKLAAAYKRPNKANADRRVVSDYFESNWQSEDKPRKPLPVAVNMEGLYERLLTPLIDAQTKRIIRGVYKASQMPRIAAAEGAALSLETRVAWTEAIKTKAHEVKQIRARLTRERQFNRRVEINAELRTVKQELERLVTRQPNTMST